MDFPDFYVKVSKEKIQTAVENLDKWLSEGFTLVDDIYKTAEKDLVQVKTWFVFNKKISLLESFAPHEWVYEDCLFSHYNVNTRLVYRGMLRNQLNKLKMLLRMGDDIYLTESLTSVIDEFQLLPGLKANNG